ncbi:rCG63285 [Rattus norvegicus]|uniref:RCG63285 n=1 Tax=Rattus norvegicus TaxID=10116 RepID=A6J4I0_RAT|nr:rCG63285 [Rattus norvegicus]
MGLTSKQFCNRKNQEAAACSSDKNPSFSRKTGGGFFI